MSFEGIVGHRAALDVLRGALRQRRLPHALLLHGPSGVGKATVARALAAVLFCEREQGSACGACHACLELARHRHPDLLVVRRLPRMVREAGSMGDGPTDDTDLSAFIRIFQIRQLVEHAAHAPREGRWRLFLIDPADAMNAESQNALLKTLEEPPGRSLLVLVTSRPHLLLPTVRSRSFSLGFAPLSTSELADELERRGLDRAEALERAALSGGRLGFALELDLEGLRERRRAILETLEALAGAPGALADLAGQVAGLAGGDEEELEEGLDLFAGLLRDAARLAAGSKAEALTHRDLADRLDGLARRLGSGRGAELVQATDVLRRGLRTNLNRTLLIESLLAAVAGGPIPRIA